MTFPTYFFNLVDPVYLLVCPMCAKFTESVTAKRLHTIMRYVLAHITLARRRGKHRRTNGCWALPVLSVLRGSRIAHAAKYCSVGGKVVDVAMSMPPPLKDA